MALKTENLKYLSTYPSSFGWDLVRLLIVLLKFRAELGVKLLENFFSIDASHLNITISLHYYGKRRLFPSQQ